MGRVVKINLLILLAGLLVLELVFGSWFGKADYGHLTLPRHVKRTFDVAELYKTDEPVIYTRDKYGLRGNYENLSDIDVLVLGGSTTNELYISDDKTWVHVMDEALGPSLTVINAGVDGQSTRGHLYNFDVWFPNLPVLKPDYVLVYVGFNDLYAQAEKYDRMASQKGYVRALRWLQNKSALYVLYQKVKGMVEAWQNDIVHGHADPMVGGWVKAEGYDEKPVAPDVLAAYTSRLAELARRIRKLGAIPIFMTQHANGYRLKDGVLYGRNGGGDIGPYIRLKAFNDATMAFCQQQKMVCFDLFNELMLQDGDFYDYVHTTPAGSAKVGRYAAGKFKQKLLTAVNRQQ